jgi:hypothetical protein
MVCMRRTVFAAVLLAASAAYAFNSGTHSIRIALLASPDGWADRRDAQTSDVVRNRVRNELRELGYDAFVTGDRLTDVARDDHPSADYYLDIAGADRGGYPVAGIGIGGRDVGVDVSIIVSHVAATVTVYDGRTLERVRTIDLYKRNTAIAPTAIAIGGRAFWAVIALPIVEWSQYRAAARAVAHDAALRVDEALRR